MAPPPKNPNLCTYLLCLLLLVSTTDLSAALTTPYSSLCSSPLSAADKHTNVDDALSLIRSFQIFTGYFSGGGGSLFSPDDDDLYGSRSFSLFPHCVSHTSDPTLLHVTATLTLTGPGDSTYQNSRYSVSLSQSISFVLDGYYSSASLELCMVGTGTELDAGGSLKHYANVVLHLRVPSPPKLTDPFVVGRLDVPEFKAINLAAYTEGDNYKYGERAPACSPPTTPAGTPRGSFKALRTNFSCTHLRQQLTRSYRLEHAGGADTSSTRRTSQLVRRMHVSQMECSADGDVRAYVVFSNGTEESKSNYPYRHHQQHRLLLDDEAVVADGHWDSARSMLCLRACRVAVPQPYTPAVQHDCRIGMSFWFPAVWSIHDRSVVAGMVWSSRQGTGSDSSDGGLLISGVMSASSIEFDNGMDRIYRSNLSEVKYNYDYTMVDEAKKHYLKIKKKQEKIKGSSFLAPGNLTYLDLRLRFFARPGGQGDAYPVTIGSAIVCGDRLAAENSYSRHPVVDTTKHDLLNVSYDIHHHAPPANWVPSRNESGSYFKDRQISAEGVYDPKRGILCMVGCREQHNDSSSTDCEILVTVQLPSLDRTTRGQGAISSLRDRSDPLFFEGISIYMYGMYSGRNQMSGAVSRMDLETILLVVSTTLSCVFTVMQILHTKKNPEAAPATSITMLFVLALGYLAPLVLRSDVLFLSRRWRFWGISFGNNRSPWVEVSVMMLRAPALIAFVLQLRLLQLAWSARRSADQSKAAAVAAAAAVAEKRVLQICLPLYALGGVLAGIVHAIHARAASKSPLVIPIGRETTTLWEDLASYSGLVLDGFLLPQIILNASLGSRVRAISPRFYVGITMIRAMPHVYDVIRAHGYVKSTSRSYIYASPRGDLFGVAWDVVIPCGAAVLALLLFMQQRLRSDRRSGGYEMVPGL